MLDKNKFLDPWLKPCQLSKPSIVLAFQLQSYLWYGKILVCTFANLFWKQDIETNTVWILVSDVFSPRIKYFSALNNAEDGKDIIIHMWYGSLVKVIYLARTALTICYIVSCLVDDVTSYYALSRHQPARLLQIGCKSFMRWDLSEPTLIWRW